MQLNFNWSDMHLQQNSTIPGVRKPNSADKSRSSKRTLIHHEIATAEELIVTNLKT